MLLLAVRDGELRAIYSDSLLPYIRRVQAQFGLPDAAVKLRRASHVEPTDCGTWFVDMTPVGGPIHYVDDDGRPFETRQRALEFEVKWLEANWLTKGESTDAGTVTEEK